MLRQVVHALSPRSLPLMTRQSYRQELRTAMTLPLVLALVEGGVAGVLALKAFDAGPYVVAIISAAPMFGNLSSFLWARLARGRRKVRLVTAQMAALLGLVFGIGLLPTDTIGLAALTGMIVIARLIFSGIVTVRSTIWRHNYPRHVRARVTGRLSQMVTGIAVTTSLAAGWILDTHETAFRVIYPAAAVLAGIGVWHFARIRLRGERALLAAEGRPDSRPVPHGETSPVYEVEPADEYRFWSILRNDPLFRKYLTWQFLAGISNMMSMPVLVYVIGDEQQLDQSYLVSILLSTALPMGLAMLSLPAWARLLDAMHIARFRVRQAWFWTFSQGLMFGGVYLAMNHGLTTPGLVMLGLAMFVMGVARGGGMLAWNLGHNDFAARNMVAAYMSVHVTLTGIRGAFAPFLGMALYAGWSPLILADRTLVPGFEGLGAWMFLIAVCLSTGSGIGFFTLARSLGPDHAVQTD